jgi:hypothetical protein
MPQSSGNKLLVILRACFSADRALCATHRKRLAGKKNGLTLVTPARSGEEESQTLTAYRGSYGRDMLRCGLMAKMLSDSTVIRPAAPSFHSADERKAREKNSKAREQ